MLTTIEFPHYQNFVDAIRANDPKLLTCDILEGHLSSALPHLANISYRVGHPLVFDGKTETFVDDKKADKLLTREYRKGFEMQVGPVVLLEVLDAIGRDLQAGLIVARHVFLLRQVPDREVQMLPRASDECLEVARHQ